MKRNNTNIIITLSLLFGWLLSFPFNGPVLYLLASKYNIDAVYLSHLFTAFHGSAFFLCQLFLKNSLINKNTMTVSLVICCFLSSMLLFLPASFFPFIIALLGVFSAIYILGWSHYYIVNSKISERVKTIASIIILANIVYYFVNIMTLYLNTIVLFILTLVPLFICIPFTMSLIVSCDENSIEKENHGHFPSILLVMLCVFVFGLCINGGFMFNIIYPSYDKFLNYSVYYRNLPYMTALIIMWFLGDKLHRGFIIYLSVSLLGMAFISFIIMPNSLRGYFLTETLIQSAWAFIDLFLWTILSDISSLYGRTYNVFGYGLSANIFAILLGGIIGNRLIKISSDYQMITGVFAAAIIFITLLIIPWLNERLNNDLLNKLVNLKNDNTTSDTSTESDASTKSGASTKSDAGNNNEGNNKSNNDTSENTDTPNSEETVIADIPNFKLLTPREIEITALILKGYTNKDIAKELYISENTLKVHTRHIYQKIDVPNRRKLIELIYNNQQY